MNNFNTKSYFIPQLDSFRFFAVLLVIFSHWLPSTLINIIPNGFLGVTFFFVLSGFLISRNLLYAKKGIDEDSITIKQALKNFFIRRTLRIFPLYFSVIFLIFILVPSVYDKHFIWYALYLPNFLVYKLQTWTGMLSHFWSLGVEEQFYLLWPFLIFGTPQKRLKYLFLTIVFISIVFKIFQLFNFSNYSEVLPISCFDAFGIGGLLAFLEVHGSSWKFMEVQHHYEKFKNILLIISILVSLVIYFLGFSFLFGFAVSVSSALLIKQAIGGYKGFVGFILDNRFVQYLGKISYGLYVYHNFIPWLLRCFTGTETKYPLFLPAVKGEWLQGGVILFVVHFLMLLVISTISWFLLEKPINDLKKYFV